MNELSAGRLASITLDEKGIVRRTPEIENERRVAIADLLESNRFTLREGGIAGPYDLCLGTRDDRLLSLTGSDGGKKEITLSLMPLRKIIKDYFLMCGSYYDAIRSATPERIETLDMARRSVHDEGAERLRKVAEPRIAMDAETARRLFTLLCVLQVRQQSTERF